MKKVKEFILSPYFIVALFALKMIVYYALIDVNRMDYSYYHQHGCLGFNIYVFGRCGLKRKRGVFFGLQFAKPFNVCRYYVL